MMAALAEVIEPTTMLEERQLLKLLELFIRLHRSVDLGDDGAMDTDLRNRVHRACVRLRIPLCGVDDDCKEGCGDIHREFVERRRAEWEKRERWSGRVEDMPPEVLQRASAALGKAFRQHKEEDRRAAMDAGLKVTEENIRRAKEYIYGKGNPGGEAFEQGFSEGLYGT